ncbi:MAG: hypothetical protein ACOC2H_02900 [Spirochaetota bacterium]
MRDKVMIDDIISAVDATLLHRGDCDYVRWVVSSGLMSDVLTTEEEEILLVSSLTTTQVVRTADMVGANAILITCGKPVLPDTIELAKELDITLLRCPLPVFETNCNLAPLFTGER